MLEIFLKNFHQHVKFVETLQLLRTRFIQFGAKIDELRCEFDSLLLTLLFELRLFDTRLLFECVTVFLHLLVVLRSHGVQTLFKIVGLDFKSRF